MGELEKSCRICLSSDSPFGAGDEMIAPCACKGTSKYVHRKCLDGWRTNPDRPRAFKRCSTCQKDYVLRKAFVSVSEEADQRRRRRKLVFLVVSESVFALALFFASVLLLSQGVAYYDENNADVDCLSGNRTCAHPLPVPATEWCNVTCPWIREAWAHPGLSRTSAYFSVTFLFLLAGIGIITAILVTIALLFSLGAGGDVRLGGGGGGGGGGRYRHDYHSDDCSDCDCSCCTGWCCLVTWAIIGAITLAVLFGGMVVDTIERHKKELKLRVLADDYVVVDFDAPAGVGEPAEV